MREHGLRLIDLYPERLELERKGKALFLKYVPNTIHPTAEIVFPTSKEAPDVPGIQAVDGKLVASPGEYSVSFDL